MRPVSLGWTGAKHGARAYGLVGTASIPPRRVLQEARGLPCRGGIAPVEVVARADPLDEREGGVAALGATLAKLEDERISEDVVLIRNRTKVRDGVAGGLTNDASVVLATSAVANPVRAASRHCSAESSSNSQVIRWPWESAAVATTEKSSPAARRSRASPMRVLPSSSV